MIKLRLILFLIAIGCNKIPNDKSYRHLIEIRNDTLKGAILQYIEETDFDKHSSYITVHYSDLGERTFYEISQGKSSEAYKIKPPDYFSVINDAVILIYFSDGNVVSLDRAGLELDRFFKSQSTILEDSISSYNPPAWRLSECNGIYKLDSESFIPRVIDYVPCGFMIKKDSLNLDSLFLIKEAH